MAVLAKPWPSYYRYAAQVRQEFSHVPVEAYATGRPAYFERQLGDTTHKFYLSRTLAHLEPRARQNLARECELLRNGHMPVLPLRPAGGSLLFETDAARRGGRPMLAAAALVAATAGAWYLWRQSRRC